MASPEGGDGACRRLLDGVPAFPGWGPASGPLFSCLRYLREPVGYPFLAAISGDAFRLHVDELRPHGPTDGEEIARTLGDLGYQVRLFLPGERDRIAVAIAETITAGVPAVAWSPSAEAGHWFAVVAGCDPGVNQVCLRTVDDDSETYQTEPIDRVAVARESGEPALYILGAKVSEPPLRELAWSALGHAVRLGREQAETSAEKRLFVGFGVRGYEAWANSLEQKSAGDRSHLVSADTVHAVRMHLAVAVDMKRQAELFLRSLATDADGEVGRRLDNAAELYHEVWDLLAGFHPLCASFRRCRAALADEDRTEEMIHALRRVAFLENLAVDAIEQAIHARR